MKNITITENQKFNDVIAKIGENVEIQIIYDDKNNPKNVVVYLDADRKDSQSIRTYVDIELTNNGRKVKSIKNIDSD
ncbi:MAG: hypothetical protein IJ870_05305 [Alphaproteobacteria bacterium]|nr:hypothetical protein [Alphaproteobacteria bacterium]